MDAQTPSNKTLSEQAEALKIDRVTLWRWIKKGRCPAERVAEASKVLGMTRHELRPDIFSADEAAA